LTVAAKRPNGQTVDFALTGKRDLATARRFFERAIDQHDIPKSITIDKNGANAAAVVIVVDRSKFVTVVRLNFYPTSDHD
jgi:transposase-like protein